MAVFPCSAGDDFLPSRIVPYPLDSGPLENLSPKPVVAFSQVIALAPEVPWVRLAFSSAHLAPGSELRITSLADGETQRLDGTALARWGSTTAFFNGSSVRIELIAAPRTSGNFFQIERLIAGESSAPGPGGRFTTEEICGGSDSRVPSADPRVARFVGGTLEDPGSPFCTAFILDVPAGNDKLHMTAGHCLFNRGTDILKSGHVSILQFDVPPSDPDTCDPVHPGVHKQFMINLSSPGQTNINGFYGQLGDDWATFTCERNSNTNKTTYEEQGGAALPPAPTVANEGTVTVIGLGRDGTGDDTSGAENACTAEIPGSCSRHRTQQQDTGGYRTLGGESDPVCHEADTCGSNSGSPIILASGPLSGFVAGVHTHAGCESGSSIRCPAGSVNSNAGTSILHPDVQAALNDADGDGVGNSADLCPTLFDLLNRDTDGDQLGDVCDNCPFVHNPSQEDTERAAGPDGQCGTADDNDVMYGSDNICGTADDQIGDLVGDSCDNCPEVPNQDQIDTDSDGAGDACDGCPEDPGVFVPGPCGCGIDETADTDKDGTPDCTDGCPFDRNKIAPGICGCGLSDTADADGDGTLDCFDGCPNDPDKTDPGQCGCGIPEGGCQPPAVIPTLTLWGYLALVAMLLLGTIVLVRRRSGPRRPAAAGARDRRSGTRTRCR